MKTEFTEIKVATRERTALVDITGQVEDAVEESGISHGICLVQSLHSTTAIVVNEHESGLMGDITNKIKKDFPKGIGWLHDRIDNNADAHQASTYLGASRSLPWKKAGSYEAHGRTSS